MRIVNVVLRPTCFPGRETPSNPDDGATLTRLLDAAPLPQCPHTHRGRVAAHGAPASAALSPVITGTTGQSAGWEGVNG